MNRTEILQEILRMRFEEAYGGWQKGQLSQDVAAEILWGYAAGHFVARSVGMKRMYWRVNDKRLTQASHRRAAVDEFIVLGEQYTIRYRSWNVKYFYS